jgi:hypothetical protein
MSAVLFSDILHPILTFVLDLLNARQVRVGTRPLVRTNVRRTGGYMEGIDFCIRTDGN